MKRYPPSSPNQRLLAVGESRQILFLIWKGVKTANSHSRDPQSVPQGGYL